MCRLRPLSGMFCSGINGKEARDSIGPKSPRFRAKRIDTFPSAISPLRKLARSGSLPPANTGTLIFLRFGA